MDFNYPGVNLVILLKVLVRVSGGTGFDGLADERGLGRSSQR